MPRIPWGAPTLSDSGKLEWVDNTGDTVAKLLHQLVESDDFANLDDWTVTDSGGNINLTGGVVSLNGNNNWSENGIVRTSPISKAVGYFEWKYLTEDAGSLYFMMGVADQLGLTITMERAIYGNLGTLNYRYSGTLGGLGQNQEADVWLTCRIYFLPQDDSSYEQMMLTVQGGSYTDETVIASGGIDFAVAESLYFQFNRRSNNVKLSKVKEWRWYSGYDTGGEYIEFTADAGAGQIFSGLDLTNMAAPTGIDTTNLKYQYSYDDGTPAYNGSWLTLAQLQAVGAVAGAKRYIRLRVQLNSDGATQVYAAEVNADDAIEFVADVIPTAATIITGNTILGVAGTFDESARNTIVASKVEDGHAYLHLGEAAEGELSVASAPSPPAWASTPYTVGDGQIVLHVVPVSESDVVYARYRRDVPGTSWSALSATFSRTGTGNITITGLTNAQQYEIAIHTLESSLPSYFSRPVFAIPDDGEKSEIELIMDAVTAELNAMGLQSVDTAGDAVDVSAAVEIPPHFESVDVPCVKVFPDTEEGDPQRSNRNGITYRIDVAFCQRSKTSAQKQEQMTIRQSIRDHFLGNRLLSLPGVICVGEAESGVVDLDALWENFQWVSMITLEFLTSRSKG